MGSITSISPDAEVGVFEQQNSLLNDTNSGPIAASSSIDEQVLKGKFCTDTDSQGEISMLSGCPFECDDEQRSLSETKITYSVTSYWKKTLLEKLHEVLQIPPVQIYCTDKPFETKNDWKGTFDKSNTHAHLLQKIHQQKDENRKGTWLGKDMNVIDERIAQEKNEIRKTYISNPHGLTPYKFQKLIREKWSTGSFSSWKWILFHILHNHHTCWTWN